jgi:hypothetical protein
MTSRKKSQVTPKRPAEKKKPVGRPSNYKAEYAEQARKLCLLGATDKELADFFEVEEKTINNWKLAHKEFLQSIKAGKVIANANVADRLYQRALGYSHPEVHISNFQGVITQTPITKHYPPDPTSAIFFLKNREKDKWREKLDVDTKVTGELTITSIKRTIIDPNG